MLRICGNAADRLVYLRHEACQHSYLIAARAYHARVVMWRSDSLILITGANGFVGQALCLALGRHGGNIKRAVRIAESGQSSDGEKSIVVGSIGSSTDWTAALCGINTVVHLAARAHFVHESGRGLLSQYREVNTEGTRRLAEMAAQAGVRRFVFLSSVKVNGERTSGHPFTENDLPQPEDAYGISKWEAEQALLNISHTTGMEVVILRPPLIYGPGVKGNFLRLIRLVSRGTPLPLASVTNSRSLLYVDNLVDAIVSCVESPAAAGRTYLVSDGEDIPTPDLVLTLAIPLHVRTRLFPFPVALLRLGATVLGKGSEILKLTESLQVDSTRIKKELGWQPRFSLKQGLEETAGWYRRAMGNA